MENLNLNEMVIIEGGCSSTTNKVIATAGLVAGVAAFAGPVGALIAGPTAIGMGIASVYCAYS
ncbi:MULTISPECIES: hypothetical protein [Flammeovirga]|uniref:Bacteriocin n=2 Tax=Flammeovirga TaxID=59739 RepID=A0A3Q9FUC5_9BACT|nr:MULTISPECIES: hypothetical protein [Flammeovirga]AZQ64757.1 hypothetical protein EI427_21265 [Flammeovirga pectinis]MBB6463667.1 hypothetical protein [Flammeovirga kamogawensis]QWG09280.1 hypothetical protein KM029_21995 [Flammeovirga kamogawensis]TRX64804.1 hypothetical protein EO216_19910 [Flammeovirga kamogawensis]